jgi:hypothetical protein
METITLNDTNLEALRSSKFGFTKALTDELGVPYPLVKGWLNDLKEKKIKVTLEYYFYLQGLSTLFAKDVKREGVIKFKGTKHPN